MDSLQQKGQRFSGSSSTLTSGSVTVTEAVSTGRSHYVTEIGGSSANATAQIRLYSGATNYWMERVGNAEAYEKVFRVPIRVSAGSAVTVELLNGGGSAYVNLAGYTI